MTAQIIFTDKELIDIYEALRLASIHTPAPGESERMHKLAQKIEAAMNVGMFIQRKP